MTDKTDRNIEAIAKLITLTQQGTIHWSVVNDAEINARNDIEGTVTSVFRATHNGTHLQIYRRSYVAKSESYFIQKNSLRNFMHLVDDEPKSKVVNQTCLEIIDSEANLLWQFPYEPILNDLLAAIRYKVSGAHDFVQSLLDQ